MTKKIIAIATALTVVVFTAGPALAITADELQAQINALLAQLSQLQSQLATIGGTPASTTACAGVASFSRNLAKGSSGTDVKCLQSLLNQSADTKVSATGAGSPGNETTFFGAKTKTAVVKFQAKYSIGNATGYVGPLTRAKLNTMLGVSPSPTVSPTASPTVVPAGALSAVLAGDTPASATIPGGGNGNFTKLTLTASSTGPVKVTKVYVTRTGLSANADLENIKIIEADTGVKRGSIGSLNVNNQAMITFTPALEIPAGTSKSFYIRAGIVSATSSGKTAALGIAAAANITSNASSVTGTFPVTGNAMSVVTLTIGTLAISEDGSTVDSKPDVGKTDVTVNQFKLTTGSTEGVTVEQLTVMKSGTSDASDTNNIELYDVSATKSLGTVTSWDAEGKASWSNLNLVLGKGETKRLKVILDVVDGTSLTVNADLSDGSDVLITAKGSVYGFYVTPTSADASWASAARNGKGTADQTINTGALNISKSASTPATGNIAAGDAIVLGVFDFDAKGEEIKISAITIEAVLVTMVYTEVTNVAIYDQSGTIVAGPQDLSSSSSAAFTDTIIVPVGIQKYTVKAKIANTVSTGDTITVDVATPGASITAKGMTSSNSITATPALDVAANTLTIAAGALVVITLDSPVARSVGKGVSDYIWATASLSATSSGENVQVTNITVTDTLDLAASDASTIDNAELWADLTSANSARGDVYETKVSSTEQPDDTDATTTTAETQAFTLTQTITVPKGSFVKLALIADLAAGATTGQTHTFKFSAATANGATTGTTITATYSGSGQAMAVSAGGTLTVTQDPTSPTYLNNQLILAGETITLAVFRLAANNVEDLDVDQIDAYVSGASQINTFNLYKQDGITAIGSANADANEKITFVLVDGTLTVPADDYIKVVLKGITKPITDVTNGTSVKVKLSPYSGTSVQTTRLATGTQSNWTTAITPTGALKVYKSRPYFSSKDSAGALLLANCSGCLGANTNQVIAIFDVKAAASQDITFESADSNYLKVSVDMVRTDTNTATDTYNLYDADATTLLDSATKSSASTYTSITFDFSSADLTITKGTTKRLEVRVDTTTAGLGLEDYSTSTSDRIQLWLDDAATTNVDWGINGTSSTYRESDIIFRNDIYSGLLKAAP